MRKDNLPVWPNNTNKGGAKSIEVFFLGEPNQTKKGDVSPDGESEPIKDFLDDCFAAKLKAQEMLPNEQDVNENSAGSGEHVGYVCDEEGHLLAIEGCCPIGHKGETGQRGYVEEDVYKLILTSLDKALPDAKESFREVVADGISKKIIKYMSGEE